MSDKIFTSEDVLLKGDEGVKLNAYVKEHEADIPSFLEANEGLTIERLKTDKSWQRELLTWFVSQHEEHQNDEVNNGGSQASGEDKGKMTEPDPGEGGKDKMTEPNPKPNIPEKPKTGGGGKSKFKSTAASEKPGKVAVVLLKHYRSLPPGAMMWPEEKEALELIKNETARRV